MAPNLKDAVYHWKKKLDRNPDEDSILNVIRKLSKIDITVEILEATHIAKSIRNLSKRDDIVGEKAKVVLDKWRKLFLNLVSTGNSKQKGTCDKGNIEKSFSKQNLIEEKQEQIEKHKKSSHHISSKQSSTHHSSKSSRSLAESEVKKSCSNDMNFHPTDSSVFYSSSPNTSGDDDSKVISLADSRALSSLKRKTTTEQKIEAYLTSVQKKSKMEKHSSSDTKEKKRSSVPLDKPVSLFESLKKGKCDGSKIKTVDAATDLLKPKETVQNSDGFTFSSISFEDCLSINDTATVKKKKISKPQPSTKKNHSHSLKLNEKKVTSKSDKATVVVKVAKQSPEAKSSISIKTKSTMFDAPKINSSSLSAVQPNFKLHQNQSSKKETHTNEDVIKFTSSRKEKTAIYSGRKNTNKAFPTLAQCCYRVLIENIDFLGSMIDTPYELLKPILERCTPNQLFSIEKYNPHLLYDTNELWEIHCKRDYKLLSPLEHETWRDVYLRGYDEHEKKMKSLKNITANISASMSKAVPQRQVKLAFIDSYVKPPRDVLRRQAKNRESSSTFVKPGLAPKINVQNVEAASCSSVNENNQTFVVNKKEKVKTIDISQSQVPSPPPPSQVISNPVANVADLTTSNKDLIAMSLAAKKPKVPPLMAKALKTMKQCFRR